jgi:hypothetical protein
MKVPFSLLLGVSLASMAGAQAPQPQPSATAQPAARPDVSEVICERQSVIGSRLAHRKVCMTRSQWDDARRQDRQATEKVQTQRGMDSGG